MDSDKPTISVETISFPKEGGYRYEVVLRATQYSEVFSASGKKQEETCKAVFTVKLSRGRRRKTEKPIQYLRKEARGAVATFCEAISSALSLKPTMRV